jgi:probable phosphoglycerate mutase
MAHSGPGTEPSLSGAEETPATNGDLVTLLYLVRHAEQEQTAVEDPAVGLSQLGRRQARLLGQRLRNVPFEGLHHSPLRRAEETAKLIAEELPEVAIHASALLTDRTPMPTPEEEPSYPARSLPWLAGVPVDEQDEGGRHISAALRHFASLGDEASTSEAQPKPANQLLITHGFVISWFIREALDAPSWRWLGLNPFNASLSVIRCLPGQAPTLISFNDVGHLPYEVRGRTPLDLLS